MRAEHADLLAAFASFVDRELRPLGEFAGTDAPPPDVLARIRRRSGELGFYAPEFPAEVGGQDLDQVGVALLRIAAGRSSVPLARHAVAGSEGPTQALFAGTDEQQERYLRPLVLGQMSRCLALSEPDTGSDATAIRTKAERVADGWVLNGRKAFVSNAEHADFAIVVARTGRPGGRRAAMPPAGVFLVDKATPGYLLERHIPCMWQGVPTWEVVLENCFVTDDQVLGGSERAGLGMYAVLDAFLPGRLSIAATALALGYRAFDIALEYARTRSAFGNRIGKYQHIQQFLVDGHVRLRAAELVVLDAARRLDDGTAGPADAAVAKLVATDWAYEVIDNMLQVLGGVGFTRDLPLEGLLRHARLYRIVDGTSELQKVLIARELIGDD